MQEPTIVPVTARTIAEQLAGEFLKNGNFGVARGALDIGSLAEVVPAANNAFGPRLPDYGFAGLSVQSVGYSKGGNEEIVHVYVTRGNQRSLDKLSAEIDGINVQVTNFGRLEIRPEAIASVSNRGNVFERNGRIACGSSCAPAGENYAGTLGALVYSKGTLMALSNNHVFAACNHIPVGQPILSPSPMDASPGLPPPRQLCRHSDIVELRSGTPPLVPLSQCDAAVAVVPDLDLVSSWQGNADDGYDTPSQTIDLFAGLRVKKVGRTTGLTFGTVQAYAEPPWALPYKNPNFSALVWFNNVWSVRADHGDLFALPGDSGSLVVTENGDSAVGLLFAANNKGTHAYIAPIQTVLDKLSLTLASNHGL